MSHDLCCSYVTCLAQLGKLQADMEALREQRESTICTTREELYSAQEEVTRHSCLLLPDSSQLLLTPPKSPVTPSDSLP